MFCGDASLANTRCAGFLYFLLSIFFVLGLPCHLLAQEKKMLVLMPVPAHIVQGEGEFVIDGKFGVALEGYKEPRLERAQQRFLGILSRETGIPLWREAVQNQPHFTIRIAGPSAAVQELGEDESYHLKVSTTDVQLTAPNP